MLYQLSYARNSPLIAPGATGHKREITSRLPLIRDCRKLVRQALAGGCTR